MRIATPLALALVLAGCLSKPDRPSGLDAAPDGRPDGAVPNVVYRRDAEVADIDNNNYDDVVRWGNLIEGESPRVWVFYGSPSGLSFIPDLEMNVEADASAAWHEVIDVRVEDYDPTTALSELLVMVAEDDSPPNGNDPVGRNVHVQGWSPVTVGTQAAQGKTETVADSRLGGLLRDPYPAYVLSRQTFDGPELIFGGLDVHWRLPNVTTTLAGTLESVTFDGGGAPLPLVQELFDTSPNPDQNLLAIAQGSAWLGDGDPTGGSYPGMANGFREGSLQRSAKVGAASTPLMVAASGAGSNIIQICREAPGSTPEVYELSLPAPDLDPVDFALGNVGGTGVTDLAVLDNNALVVYKDLVLDSSGTVHTATGTMVQGPTDLSGYNLIVIGNFSDAGSGNELYLLGPAPLAPRCLVLNGNLFEGC